MRKEAPVRLEDGVVVWNEGIGNFLLVGDFLLVRDFRSVDYFMLPGDMVARLATMPVRILPQQRRSWSPVPDVWHKSLQKPWRFDCQSGQNRYLSALASRYVKYRSFSQREI